MSEQHIEYTNQRELLEKALNILDRGELMTAEEALRIAEKGEYPDDYGEKAQELDESLKEQGYKKQEIREISIRLHRLQQP